MKILPDEERYIATALPAADPVLADVQASLRTPLSIADLRESLARRQWEEDALGSLPACLDELLTAGAVVRVSDLDFAARTGDEQRDRNVTHHCFPTRDRPEQLGQSLAAWHAFERENGFEPSWIVCDDSLERAQATKAVALAFAGNNAAAVVYMDRHAKSELIKELPPHLRRATEFAIAQEELFPELGSYGGNRNFLLLVTAGLPVSMSDDDIFPEFRALSSQPEHSDSIALTSGPLRRTAIPAGEWNQLISMSRPIDTADYEATVGVLGRRCSSVIQDYPTIDVADADWLVLEAVRAQTGHVAVIAHTYWGDSGSTTSSYLLHSRSMLEWDVDSPDTYESCVRKRLIFRNPSAPTLGVNRFMGGYLLLGPQGSLPPFSPQGRNDDSVWATCLKWYSQSCVFTPAYAVKHAPSPGRTSTREQAIRTKPGINDILLLLLGMAAETAETQQGSSQGAALMEIVSFPRKELISVIEELVFQALRGRKGMLEENLRLFDHSPAPWTQDVEAAIAYLEELVTEPDFWLPEQLEHKKGGVLDYLRRYAELLLCWEEIYHTSAALVEGFLDRFQI